MIDSIGRRPALPLWKTPRPFLNSMRMWRITIRRAEFLCSSLSLVANNGAAKVNTMPNFEKKNYNYSEWTKERFSEVVTVSGPGKMIFLAGVGAEDENGTIGTILYPGDFRGQCRYAFDKVKRNLARHQATVADIVKIVAYVTDIRSGADYFNCLTEALGDAPRPAHTFLNINQLAHPGMLVEIDVTAIVSQGPD
jgi:2-iminobutanoate/2-iminopropanoate deaminase